MNEESNLWKKDEFQQNRNLHLHVSDSSTLGPRSFNRTGFATVSMRSNMNVVIKKDVILFFKIPSTPIFILVDRIHSFAIEGKFCSIYI